MGADVGESWSSCSPRRRVAKITLPHRGRGVVAGVLFCGGWVWGVGLAEEIAVQSRREERGAPRCRPSRLAPLKECRGGLFERCASTAALALKRLRSAVNG